MGETGFQNVGDELVGQLAIGQPTARAMVLPGAGVYFVDTDWAMLPIKTASFVQPVTIAPGVSASLGDHGGIGGPMLKSLTIRVSFDDLTASRADRKLVYGPGPDTRYKQRPDSRALVRPHHVLGRIPAVEISNHTD